MNNMSQSFSGQVHLETALLALKLGFSPFPPREDGSKAPGGAWKDYQTAPASEDAIRTWFRNRTGMGLICGVGNLECFEFDDAQTHHDFLEAAWSVGLADLVDRIRVGYEEVTPGGGYHWLYRVANVLGNTKLACRPLDGGKVKPLIETRGKGGYVVDGAVQWEGSPQRRGVSADLREPGGDR